MTAAYMQKAFAWRLSRNTVAIVETSSIVLCLQRMYYKHHSVWVLAIDDALFPVLSRHLQLAD